jgi:DNA/RNA endonuclease G (NUC1)
MKSSSFLSPFWRQLVTYCDSSSMNGNNQLVMFDGKEGNSSFLSSIMITSAASSSVKTVDANGEGFFVYYDTKTRNPLCVIEKLSRSDIRNDRKHDKRPPFFVENRLPFLASHYRVHPKEYNDSKYDRGHMVPAADFIHSSDLYPETFSMINISPQVCYGDVFAYLFIILLSLDLT